MNIVFDPMVNTYADFVVLAKRLFHADEIFYFDDTGNSGVQVFSISRDSSISMITKNYGTGHVTAAQVIADFPSAVAVTHVPTFS